MKYVSQSRDNTDVLMLVEMFSVDLTPGVSLTTITAPVSVKMDLLVTPWI